MFRICVVIYVLYLHKSPGKTGILYRGLQDTLEPFRDVC